MKRIIRLNESELARIVRRVVNEYSLPNMGYQDDLIDTRKTNGGDTWSKTKLSKHMVSKGDTLSGIASKYGLTLDQLIKLNPGLDDPNKIFTGQMIKLK